jgi:hypothetical protein
VVGPEFGAAEGPDVAFIMGLVGAFVGAVGGALIGTILGGVGELICSKLGLDKLLRARLGGRLDDIWGRLLYGGLLGAIGGPIFLVAIRRFYEGFGGIVDSFLVGAIFWGFWGIVGGGIDWAFNWSIQTKRPLGSGLIGGALGILTGLICGIIVVVTSGAIVPAALGAMVLAALGVGVGLMIRAVAHRKVD